MTNKQDNLICQDSSLSNLGSDRSTESRRISHTEGKESSRGPKSETFNPQVLQLKPNS